jgi:hypothetical protein
MPRQKEPKLSEMTLRDHFAAQALAGVSSLQLEDRDAILHAAALAYAVADAMITVRTAQSVPHEALANEKRRRRG